MQDPLKQGLKQLPAFQEAEPRRKIRMQDPLKQGLKPGIWHIVFISGL